MLSTTPMTTGQSLPSTGDVETPWGTLELTPVKVGVNDRVTLIQQSRTAKEPNRRS
jgi:hypothetical protein